MEQKIAAYRYYINRMITFPMNKENKRKEWNTICRIAHNNNFLINVIKKTQKPHRTKQNTPKCKGQQKIGHIHVLHPKNTKSNKPIQTDRNKNSI